MTTFIIGAVSRRIRIHPTHLYDNYAFLLGRSASTRSQRPLAKFFAQFPGFQYNPRNFASKEIRRLRSSEASWKSVYYEKDALLQSYRDALAKEFNERYGTDENDLPSWKGLAKRIGLTPIPDTLEECREMVTNTHVNIVDLLHVHGTSDTVKRFASVRELSEYTNENERYFPRKNANSGNLLKYLLRHILDPNKEGRHRDGSGRGKGKRGAASKRHE